MTEVTRSFCSHQNFVPWGCMPPAPGLYTCIKSWKKLYKIRLQRHFFETCSKWVKPFCWHQNVAPWGLSAPASGLYTCIKSWKNCTKSDFKDILLKLATNEWSDETFLLTSKLCPLGAVWPCPGTIYIYKIMKNWYKIRLQRDIFETCNKWPKWQDVPVDNKISSPRCCQSLPWGYIHV